MVETEVSWEVAMRMYPLLILCAAVAGAVVSSRITVQHEVAGIQDSPPLEGKYFKQAFHGPCPDRSCRITYNPGGKEHVFKKAAEEVLGGYAELVVIDGNCYSGCVLFADLAREKVCLTDKAKMYLHKARATFIMGFGQWRMDLVTYTNPHHSKDVIDWAQTKGGFPYDNFVEMDTAAKASIWRRC